SSSAVMAVLPLLLTELLAGSLFAPRWGNIIHSRIEQGQSAEELDFPYIVGLVLTKPEGKFSCGGSIIDHKWILTAAHCTRGAKSVEIYYGSIWNGESQILHKVGASSIIDHPDYDNDNLENDIALIRTPYIEFSETISKVDLADRDESYQGAWVLASGWGSTGEGKESPEILQYAKMQILSDEECFEGLGHESTNILCVSTWNGKSIGSGDSGGPLVTVDEEKLVGVSSFTVGSVAGFQKVSYHRDWIRDNTGI
ncbi:hypothetical protein KR222_009284, partial [Zaprionus bogoriensis]